MEPIPRTRRCGAYIDLLVSNCRLADSHGRRAAVWCRARAEGGSRSGFVIRDRALCMECATARV